MRGLVVAGIAAVALMGCARSQYLADTYGSSLPILFQTGQDHWAVVDNPSKSKIFVQRDYNRLAAQGAAVAPLPKARYEQTAVAFLAKDGRTCQLTGSMPLEPSWEFDYQCQSTLVAGDVRPKG